MIVFEEAFNCLSFFYDQWIHFRKLTYIYFDVVSTKTQRRREFPHTKARKVESKIFYTFTVDAYLWREWGTARSQKWTKWEFEHNFMFWSWTWKLFVKVVLILKCGEFLEIVYKNDFFHFKRSTPQLNGTNNKNLFQVLNLE